MTSNQTADATQFMNYQITHTTHYKYASMVPECFNTVRLKPRDLQYQRCLSYQLDMIPRPLDSLSRTDSFGNSVGSFSIYQPFNTLSLTAASRVEVHSKPSLSPTNCPSWEDVVNLDPKNNIAAERFKTDSKHIQRSPNFVSYASQSFTQGRPIIEAGIDLTRRIFEDFEFSPGYTTISTPVDEVFNSRKGVCQDFAHFQIACLRSLGLPARYVSGYVRTIPPPGQARLVGADASHAWLSLFCGDLGWVSFDPTNNAIPDTDHITLAWGRDYFDVCPIQGVFTGGGKAIMQVEVDVEPLV